MTPSEDERKPRIDFKNLQFEPFKVESSKIRGFDCGKKELNDFLCTNEVKNYEKENCGRTTLVFYDGTLVAYYTLNNDGIRSEYLKTYRSFTKLAELRLKSIPAVTIGRLAVSRDWQRRGMGSILLQKIAMISLKSAEQFGIRFILVQAKKEAFNFYLKYGFDFVAGTNEEEKRFKARGTRTMFFDLRSIEHI